MNIQYISSSVIPSRAANSVHVMKMCQAFVENHATVTLYSMNDAQKMEPDINDDFYHYGVRKHFAIKKILCPPIKGRAYVYGLLASRKAIKNKPDLIFCRNLASAYFSSRSGISTVFEAHSPLGRKNGIGAHAGNYFFKRMINEKGFKGLVVITNALKIHYEKTFPTLTGKIFVAPDGADILPINTKPIKLTNSHNRLQVGYVGHLYHGRGIDIIIDLAKLCNWADFHLVGGREEDIDFWRKKSSHLDNVIFHGFKPPSSLDSYRAAFDILLAPYQHDVSIGDGSITAQWMSPLKVFEYMSAGKPIIASDLPVLHEVLSHNKNAILCEPSDSQKWAQALAHLKANPDICKSLGENARKDLDKNFTWSVRAKNLIQRFIYTSSNSFTK